MKQNEPNPDLHRPFACTTCHRRKVKCTERSHPAGCQSCRKMRSECIFPDAQGYRKPAYQLERLEARIESLSEQLRTITQVISSDKKRKYSDEESPVNKPKNAFQAFEDSSDRLPITTLSPLADGLPPQQITFHLLSTYFRFSGARVLVQPRALIRSLRNGKVFRPLLFSLLASAARYVNCQDPKAAAGTFAARAKQELRVDIPSVEAIQSCLLIMPFMAATSREKPGFMELAVALRMCQSLRLHRLDEDENDSTMSLQQLNERETSRRVFWACFIRDRIRSAVDCPALFDDEDVCMRLPGDDHAWLSETKPTFKGALFDCYEFSGSPNNDEFSTTEHTTYSCYVRLSFLIGRIAKYVTAYEKEKSKQSANTRDSPCQFSSTLVSTFRELQNGLTVWWDTLPLVFTQYPDAKVFPHLTLYERDWLIQMQIYYHSNSICLLRCNPEYGMSPYSNNAQKCSQNIMWHADQSLVLLEKAYSNAEVYFPIVADAAVSIASVYLGAAEEKNGLNLSRRKVEFCRRFIAKNASQWEFAVNFKDKMDALLLQYNCADMIEGERLEELLNDGDKHEVEAVECRA